MSARVIGIGTASVDDLLHVPNYPPADGKAPVLRAERACGGQVATALAAAARLGCATSFAGTLGEDELSSFLRAAFGRCGVGMEHLAIHPHARPIHSVIIAEEAQGTRTIFYDRTGMQPFPLGSIHEDWLRGADILLVDQLSEEECLRAARIARSLGIPVVGDFEWKDRPRTTELLGATDHLLLSHDFVRGFTGLSSPEEAALELHRRHPRACTGVTCGKEGCHYVTAASFPTPLHDPSFPVKAVSTTGCGDVFHGAYAVALARKMDIPAAIRFAAATAATYAGRPNGWEHLPSLDEVNALLATRKDRP